MSYGRRPPSAGVTRSASRERNTNYYAENGNTNNMQQDSPFQPSPPSSSSSNHSNRNSGSGPVKLPPAVFSSNTSNTSNEGLMELRNALTREIDYRRQLENEVTQLKDTVQLLSNFQFQQQQQMLQQQSNGVGVGAAASDARSGSSSSKPTRPPSPARSVPANVSLAPVAPFTSKMNELEEAFNAKFAELQTRQSDLTAEYSKFDTRMQAFEQLRADMEAHMSNISESLKDRQRSDMTALEQRLVKQESMHEQHAHTLTALTSTLSDLRRSFDERQQDFQSLAQLQLTSDSHSKSLDSLSNLTHERVLKQIEDLKKRDEARTDAIQRVQQQSAADNTSTSGVLKDVSSRIEETSKLLKHHITAAENITSQQTTRFRHVEEAIRSVPTIDPQIAPRVNNLHVDFDRLNQTVEMLQKNMKKLQAISGGSAKAAPAAAAAANPEADENMRAIRNAIGTVDKKITESNELNTQLHERMNGIDASLAQSKKAVNDMINRVKTIQQASKEVEGSVESLQASHSQLETRTSKIEGDLRVKDSKERERKRQEKEEASASAASAPSATQSIPADMTVDDIPESWKKLLDDKLKNERGKSKVAAKTLELAQQETANLVTAVTTRVEQLETGRKKQISEDKKRSEERVKEREQQLADEESKWRAWSNEQSVASTDTATRLREVNESVTSLDSTVASLSSTVHKLESQSTELRESNQSQLKLIESRLESMDGTSSAESQRVQSQLQALRTEVESVQQKSTQQFALTAECSREVSRIEQLCTQMQQKIQQQAEGAAASPPPPTSSLNENRVIELIQSNQQGFSHRLSDLESRPSLPQVDPAITQFSASVHELQLRHSQFSRELDRVESKLAEHMAQTDYANQAVDIIATQVKVDLPKRKLFGS